MSNPSEALAAHILDRLTADGLLRPEDVKPALSKFAGGKLTADDWRLYVEKAAAAAPSAGPTE